jgi:hypothetical protein
LDGDIVGGKLGASVYKESLDRDELTQDCDIAGILHPIADPVHCHSNRERASLRVSGSKQGRVLHEAVIWQLLSKDRLGIRMTLFGSGVLGERL